MHPAVSALIAALGKKVGKSFLERYWKEVLLALFLIFTAIFLLLTSALVYVVLTPWSWFFGAGGGVGVQVPEQTPGAVAAWGELIDRAARDYSLDPDLIRAVMAQESGGNPLAVSPAGALGLMQVTPDKFNPDENPFDPWTNIRAGASYLKRQLDRFKKVELALAAYNAGPGAVKKYGGIPPYEETQNYVARVLGFYRKLKGGGDGG